MTATDPEYVSFGPFALLCGSGRLPEILCEKLVSEGVTITVIDFSDRRSGWSDRARVHNIPLSNPGRVFEVLREAGIKTVCFCGGIAARPSLSDFGFDRVFLKYAWRIARGLWMGDDGLLTLVIRIFEQEGFRVIGAQAIMPQLLAEEGCLTLSTPDEQAGADLKHAMRAARLLGAKDIGQAAVARGGRVIAREDRFGTAHMLKGLAIGRVGRSDWSGVLAKVSKPGQELRIDLPSIGPDTISQCHAAGLAGIVVEADRALLIERDEIIKRADELGLFVCARRVLTDE